MGKPYQKELEQMPRLYAWANSRDINELSHALLALCPYSLVAIGSGGSLTTAHIASSLHQTCIGKISHSATPLEVVQYPILSDTAYLFLTAEGKNPDILGAFDHVARREPRQLIVVCGALGSPLVKHARAYEYVKMIELDIPTGKDGFVATNSLLAFAILLTRAYTRVANVSIKFPPSLEALLHPQRSLRQTLRILEETSRPVLQREHVLVLYGPTCQAAAIDLESKYSEAALGAIQLADYRNFAHGRHHWLDKRESSSGIIAFVSDDDKPIADRTLKLIPQSIPILKVPVPHMSMIGSLSALISALHLIGLAGRIRGIDPGQPGVPGFGRRIYHLKPRKTWSLTFEGLGPVEGAAIRRKAGLDLQLLIRNGTIEFWKQQLQAYLQQLTGIRFQGIVCDYDGTLCQPSRPIEPDMGKLLEIILTKGWILGIATGRGKSVREDLRKIIKKSNWPRIVLGYYNGAEIARLDDDYHPDSIAGPCPALVPVMRAIKKDSHWETLGQLTFRQWQITLAPSNLRDPSLWDAARSLAKRTQTTLLQSTHSIDFVPPGVSKMNLTRHLQQILLSQGRSDRILCVGDLGRNPGNDADMLASPFGLSVDEVSSDPHTCWNLAPPGYRGVQATIKYLTSIVSRHDGFSLDTKKLGLISAL